ncbi:hypothetical protein ABVN80_08460 [Acinetobacter baumannii]
MKEQAFGQSSCLLLRERLIVRGATAYIFTHEIKSNQPRQLVVDLV